MTPMTADEVRREADEFLEREFDRDLPLRAWLERLADSGWACPTWPEQWFGRGLSNDLAAAAFEQFRVRNVPGPPSGVLGRMLAAPTILAHGTDEQKARYVRAILVGDEAWCQLFSEPGAGSDLASLQTRAVRDGDEYVVNGQKVWTSGGMAADFGMLLVRTDVDVSKHRGITYFALDMEQPGVDVRPLKQMTGDAQFAEVFLTDARVPVSAMLGPLNGGWQVAMTTLTNERVALGAASGIGFPITPLGGRRFREQLDMSVRELQQRSGGGRRSGAGGGAPGAGVESLVSLAKELGRDKDPLVRQQLAEVYTLSSLNRWNGLRAKAAAKAGKGAGAESSLGKLMFSHVLRSWRTAASTIAEGGTMLSGSDAPLDGQIAYQALYAPAPSIYGGSDQIQRNIIGERVLGLPREPDGSKDLPFRDLTIGTQSTRA